MKLKGLNTKLSMIRSQLQSKMVLIKDFTTTAMKEGTPFTLKAKRSPINLAYLMKIKSASYLLKSKGTSSWRARSRTKSMKFKVTNHKVR